MKRAALYLRVSTVDQHPETQLHDLEQMAAQRGLEIVERYTDHGVSGIRVRRPALDKMMSDAHRGRFDVVLVWACDRLARSTKHFLEVLDQLGRLNIEFISFREQLDTGGALGRAVFVIISAIAELEQLDRGAGARRHAAREAGRPTYRSPAARSRSRCHPPRPCPRHEPGSAGEGLPRQPYHHPAGAQALHHPYA